MEDQFRREQVIALAEEEARARFPKPYDRLSRRES